MKAGHASTNRFLSFSNYEDSFVVHSWSESLRQFLRRNEDFDSPAPDLWLEVTLSAAWGRDLQFRLSFGSA